MVFREEACITARIIARKTEAEKPSKEGDNFAVPLLTWEATYWHILPAFRPQPTRRPLARDGRACRTT